MFWLKICTLVLLSGCVTTPSLIEAKCPSAEIKGFGDNEVQESLDTFLAAEKGCQTKHSPKICAKVVRKIGPGAYQVLCGLPE